MSEQWDGSRKPWKLREPTKGWELEHAARCPGREGFIEKKSGQNVVKCGTCGVYVYTAPKSETGEAMSQVNQEVQEFLSGD